MLWIAIPAMLPTTIMCVAWLANYSSTVRKSTSTLPASRLRVSAAHWSVSLYSGLKSCLQLAMFSKVRVTVPLIAGDLMAILIYEMAGGSFFHQG